jgi:hypothetical protein
MANTILAHIDSDSYQIPLRNLEDVHLKIRQTGAVLSILSDWVCEVSGSSFIHEHKDNMMQILFLLTDLMQEVEKLLPEV